MKKEEIELIQTCGACPEQYDAYVNDKQVGYLRLRHAYFRAEGKDGTIVYESFTKGDGIFEDDERDHHLDNAKEAIAKSWTT